LGRARQSMVCVQSAGAYNHWEQCCAARESAFIPLSTTLPANSLQPCILSWLFGASLATPSCWVLQASAGSLSLSWQLERIRIRQRPLDSLATSAQGETQQFAHS